MKPNQSFDAFIAELNEMTLTKVSGRITEVVGMLIRAIVPHVKMGEVCLIKRPPAAPLLAEVVGFTREEVLLSPLGEMNDIGPASEVIATHVPLHIKVGRNLLGRVLNAMGEPLDEATKGPLVLTDTISVVQSPPSPMDRRRIKEPLCTGVRAIDGLLTVGKGQRIGIFAAAGGGKSTLLGMIARYAKGDVNVIILVGERGREVMEFLENDLGAEGLERSVVVVSTSDQAAQLRLMAAYVGTAIAEYFRDLDDGHSVILMLDSVTRYARALREVGLAAGEPPARAGYTPYVFSMLPKLLERAGASAKGWITAFYTILVAGDDPKEPVADEVRSILDGHFELSGKLAAQNHYPAINIPTSLSRLQSKIASPAHLKAAGTLRDVLATYEQIEVLLRVGEYKAGSDKKADYAIKHKEPVDRFLKQRVEEFFPFDETVRQLQALFT